MDYATYHLLGEPETTIDQYTRINPPDSFPPIFRWIFKKIRKVRKRGSMVTKDFVWAGFSEWPFFHWKNRLLQLIPYLHILLMAEIWLTTWDGAETLKTIG